MGEHRKGGRTGGAGYRGGHTGKGGGHEKKGWPCLVFMVVPLAALVAALAWLS